MVFAQTIRWTIMRCYVFYFDILQCLLLAAIIHLILHARFWCIASEIYYLFLSFIMVSCFLFVYIDANIPPTIHQMFDCLASDNRLFCSRVSCSVQFFPFLSHSMAIATNKTVKRKLNCDGHGE